MSAEAPTTVRENLLPEKEDKQQQYATTRTDDDRDWFASITKKQAVVAMGGLAVVIAIIVVTVALATGGSSSSSGGDNGGGDDTTMYDLTLKLGYYIPMSGQPPCTCQKTVQMSANEPVDTKPCTTTCDGFSSDFGGHHGCDSSVGECERLL